ncbi:MAG: hypothetical protein KAI70_05240 [Candidatus Omnitrophica bacterium]|nr:hypothetical protein [Candidatus Omnitrophota bacterium]
MLSNVIASEVWGKANIDSFRAAVLVQEQIAKGRDIFDIKKDGENVIFYMSDGTSELLSIRVLLDAVHQRDIDGQMEILPEENFKDIENINDILDEIKGFLGSIGADQKILDSVDALKGNNIDGGALVRTVEGITFRGHAGGQGIRINADLKEKAMKTTIIHEIIAGLYGDHFLAGRVEIAYLADNTNQKILAEETFLSNAIWNMTPDERLMVDRDFSARDASQRNKIVAVLRQHLDEIFSQDSLRNTFHTMAYWEDVFRKAGALELFNEAQPIIRELIKSGRTVYNSGNWHTGKDLIKPMISKLGEFSEEGKTIALERAEKVSITTRRARGQSQDPKSALRDIMGEIITQKQRTNSVFLPIIRIQNGLITGLIYDRNAVRAFEETLSSLGLKPALGSVVAAEFEEAVEAFPQRIVVDNAASVDRFLRYLAERYGVGEQEEASEEAPEKAEDVTITEINQIIERIRSQAPDPNAVERTIRDVVEPWLLRMSQEEAGRMLFELNEKCLISLGYVIQISPVGRRDEKWIVLYKAYKIEEIDIQGESVDVLYLRQVTRFSDGILRGNPGWSDFKQKYVAVFTESIEQEVDKVIMPALRNGELPFKGIRRSSEYANIQQLAEISLQLLQKEFSGKSRQEIIELIEESTKRHEVRHKRNEITKNREWGDSINGLDEETSAELDALRVAPYYNIFQLIQLSLSQQSYKLPFNVFGFLGKEIGSPFIPRGRDLGGLINWLVGKKGIGGFFAKQGVIDLTRSDLERKAIAASERFERDVNIADIGLDAVEHRVVNEVVRKAAIEGRLEDRGEVNGKRIIVIKGIDFLVANQRGHAGVERNVVYIAEGAFNDTLVLHEAIELQKWQEKALELAGVDVITDWNSLTNRQRREYKQLLRQWIRDNIFEARKLEERYHKEANLSANVEAGEVVEDSYVEDSLSEIKDPIETRKTAVEKLLSSIQGKSMIVKTIAGIPSSEEAPEFVTTVFSTIGDVNRDLAKSGFGIVKSTAYSQEGDKKQIVTFALYANNPQATQENIKKAVDIANRLFRDQLEPGQDGHIVLFAPQMDQGRGPQVALNVQENYKTENNITVVPDAYTDYNLGEKQYPDIQARGALARHIAFGRICERNNNIVGRDIALEAIKEFLMRESGNENLDAIKTIEDLLKVENTLRIRAIDYQEIVQWAESQKAVDTSL